VSLFIALATVVCLPLLLGGGKALRQGGRLATLGLLALVALSVLRSAVATRLDGVTIDEPYHITSGISYVHTGDFRLNPEHPPLSKLWVGALLPATSFELPPLRPLDDKPDERRFTQGAIFTDNDPALVQGRSRAAMFALNALLLLSFALAVRRLLGVPAAFGALGFLALDPTVAAHLPVAMTDLPVALAGATAVLAALLALESGRWTDVLAAALAMGATLGAKHSGLVAAVAAMILGIGWGLALLRREEVRAAGMALLRTAAVLLGAVIVLWGLYGFRFAASPGEAEAFNLPLGEKIEHVRTPVLRAALEVVEGAHLLPRAYIWGLADVTRSGLEGRILPTYFLGRTLLREAPFYFFPVILAVKVPLGLTLAAILGLAALVVRREPAELRPVAAVVGFAVFYLVVLGSSSSAYAGVRHALPVLPALAVLAAVAVDRAWQTRSRAWRAAVAAAFLGAAVSALPVMRPWEYYNELIGGPANAWRWFGDEGVDMGLRSREAVGWYRELVAAGREPHNFYGLLREHREREGLPDSWVVLGEQIDATATVTGTFLISARALCPSPWYDLEAFRLAEPVDRRGNLLLFEGSFRIPWLRAGYLAILAYRAKQDGEREAAERYFAEAVELFPEDFWSAIELGNLRAQRGARAEALAAFELALAHAPAGEPIVAQLERHLERLASAPPDKLPLLRNPSSE